MCSTAVLVCGVRVICCDCMCFFNKAVPVLGFEKLDWFGGCWVICECDHGVFCGFWGVLR